jgi:hypothetical protein
MVRTIEALDFFWKEAGGTEVNHENISGDPVHIINRHLRNATVERCYHASKFCSGSVENISAKLQLCRKMHSPELFNFLTTRTQKPVNFNQFAVRNVQGC